MYTSLDCCRSQYALYAVRVSVAKIKIIKKLSLPVLAPYALLARVGNNKDKSNLKHLISSVKLFKLINCDKPRRATKAAAAARFFDDDARNLYGAYLRGIKRKYAPHVPEACLTAAREISGVRAKKIPQMRHFCGAAQSNKNAGVFI